MVVLVICITVNSAGAFSQPTPRRSDIKVKSVAAVNSNAVRVKRDPASGRLYVVQKDGVIQRVDLQPDTTGVLSTVYQTSDHGLNAPLGIAFGPDGTIFLSGNDSTGLIGTATVVKGVPDAPGSENRTWTVLAKTVPYQYGKTYAHRVSGMILTPAGDSLIVNSGAATDHGEVRDGKREVGLTSIIWKLPVNRTDITLEDDRDWLRANGYLFAEGIRNTFDFAYSGNGDLFGVENSGDRDDPDELNWIQEGHHYGFPWRLGGDATPQQFTPYNPMSDPLLSPNAWGGGPGQLYITFSNDTTYPARPDSITFDEPVKSMGPDADRFRDTLSGAVMDAGNLGKSMTTFTPHRSPDGIVFDRDSILAGDLKGGGFVTCISNSSLITALGDTGQDLLHLSLSKTGDHYEATVTRLISGFRAPISTELAGNVLFVLETGLQGNNSSPKLWAVTLPAAPTTGASIRRGYAGSFELDQNYPNPFNPSTAIDFFVPRDDMAILEVYTLLGQSVRTLVDGHVAPGRHSVVWDGRDWHGIQVGSGVYFYRLTTESGFSQTRTMTVLR
jgi:glucose/arabinose dehydrogenase